METPLLKNVSKYVIDQIPELSTYSNYLSLNNEERFGLPYVFFGVLHNFYVDNFADKEVRKKINEILEVIASSGKEDLEELVCFGFLENINMKSSHFEDMINGFGKNTRRLLRETIEHNKRLGQIQARDHRKSGIKN